MPQNVAALVGENAYGILAAHCRTFMELIGRKGIKGYVFDLNQPGWSDALAPLIKEGLLYCWGFGGIGATVGAKGQSAWDAFKVPFVSVHADPPYWVPTSNFVNSRWVVNGYQYRDYLDFQRTHIRAPNPSGLLPIGVYPNVRRDATPWSQRRHRMVFVKMGQDPAALRAKWAAWPRRLRAVLEDAGAELCSRGIGAIDRTVRACLAAHDLYLEERRDLFYALLTEVDIYVRACRSTAVATALAGLPADVFGPGWEHVNREGAAARFHAAVPATDLEALYADTQYLVNTTPNHDDGVHERVLFGFAAKCCVVSDDNDYSRAGLARVPSYRGFEWHEPALADRLAAIFHDRTAYDDQLQPALDLIDREHDPMAFLDALAELAAIPRFADAALTPR